MAGDVAFCDLDRRVLGPALLRIGEGQVAVPLPCRELSAQRLYLGLKQLMRIRAEHTVGFVIILGVSGVIMNFVLRAVMGHFIGAGFLGARIIS